MDGKPEVSPKFVSHWLMFSGESLSLVLSVTGRPLYILPYSNIYSAL